MNYSFRPKNESNKYYLYEIVDVPIFLKGIGKQKIDQLEHLKKLKLLSKYGKRIVKIGLGYGRLVNFYQGIFKKLHYLMFQMFLRLTMRIVNKYALFMLGEVNKLLLIKNPFDSVIMALLLTKRTNPL